MVVDQSGRIEETNRDTIIALADKKRSFTLKITANLKRKPDFTASWKEFLSLLE